MRTLAEILETAKDGQKPDYDECYYAMLALGALHAFDVQDMLKIHQRTPEEKNPFGVKFLAEESFNRGKKALSVSPKDYVGWAHDPANPEYQQQRNRFKKLLDKIEKKDGEA